ncbi:Outer membrane usher protein fimD precursor [Serratia proteamaculans]|uniref:fimbria/pilus outer membrane usher protein n=1 Tax=Serratia proteamaculans TaxID=28151 RepID=UPI00217BC2A2|nr:fimbria/pilus outer membrane usher protein [Serratia proteamaculans]CAI0940406.1 Outer membrane usher protein fimD precursor [Serratia proteamaculans]CAI1739525.1 Outer membrane usher protein fimD precursor [Serratia proteamaculans]
MKQPQRMGLSPTRLAILIALQLLAQNVQARDYFNPALLELDGPQQGVTNLATFEENGSQLPGDYRVDVLINEQQVDTRTVTFAPGADGQGLQPCISVAELATYGVRVAQFPALGAPDAACANLAAIPQASAHLLFDRQQLALSIPQAALARQPRGYVPPAQWDEGITALLLNYSLSGANNTARGGGNGSNSSSQYANLRPGFNAGPWRLRNYTTWSRSSDGQDKWDTVYTYAQRNLIALKSQLTLGDSNAPAEVFDAVPFRGLQIASDDEMLPDSLRGYAPVVRGIARTNAQVVVRQNGYEIYRAYVAPGAFVINDMYPTGGSGDLQVTIKEADGREQHIVVPFASLPVLQREGRLKYSLTGGQYRSYDRSVDKSTLVQGTAIYGLPWNTTLYGGVQAAQHYQSAALGVGNNLGDWGAFSLDMTQSRAQPKHKQRATGQSWRVRYSKNLVQTGTNFAIAGYRYSTAGFYSLSEVLDGWRSGSAPLWMSERRRNRAELSMNQQLWQDGGSLSLSAVREDYWNSDRNLASFGLGYSNSWRGISYGINWSHNRNTQGTTRTNDQQIAFNLNVPLNLWDNNNAWVNYSLNNTKGGATSHNLGLSGVALRDNSLSWGLQQTYGTRGQGYGGNANLDYRGTYGEATAGYSYDKNTQRLNYGLNGSVAAHRNGVTLGQPLGETAALVAAPGADGASISNQTGVRTDFRGYALVPYLTPYRRTEVALSPDTLPDDVDLPQSSRRVTPTRGALVRADFTPRVGARVLMTLKQANGQPVPFGATVSDSNPEAAPGSSIVGDGGQVYLSGVSPQGSLQVKWGSGEQCRVSYQLPQTTQPGGISQMEGACR